MKRFDALSTFGLLWLLCGCFSKEAGDNYGLNTKPTAPTEVELSSPSTTYGSDTTPTILVKGVSSGNYIKIFSDENCVNELGAAHAFSSSVLVSVSAPMPLGIYTFFANASNSIGTSGCSSSGVTYILGSGPSIPENITLFDPSTNSSDDTTPTISVEGVQAGQIVSIFSDSGCLNLKGQTTVASGSTSALITVDPALSAGNYLFYANATNIYGTSNCTLMSVAYSLSTAPNPPTRISLVDPETSPSHDTTPEILVHGVANGYEIKIYSNPNCTGSPLKTEQALAATHNITLNSLAFGSYAFYATSGNSYGVSPCSSTTGVSLSYSVGSNPSTPSNLSLASPLTTPGVNSRPTISINGVVSGNTVRLFVNNACTGSPITDTASGPSKELTLTAPLSLGAHTFYANTSNIYGTSGCSGPLTYTYETCPSGYLHVPRNTLVGTNSDFCVMKYEAKAYHSASQVIDPDGCLETACSTPGWGINDHTPVSSSTSFPWRRLSAAEASSECRSLNSPGGVKYDLISNSEWMTIARNAESVSSNWNNGSVGYGQMPTGWSIAENTEPAPTNGLNCQYNTGADSCASHGDFLYKRTLRLSNGEEIWDFSGNVWEWVDWNRDSTGFNLGPTNCTPSPAEFPDVVTNTCYTSGDLLPHQVFPATSNGSSMEAFGRFLGGPGGASRRGGGWSDGLNAGTFALALNASSTNTFSDLGFRCVYRP
jgi:formylglycine-generating enzyme required for sulfatase activity